MHNHINIALVDDYAIFREGLRAGLTIDPSIEVLFEASNGVELLKKLEVAKPDIILMDLNMPEMDGRQATKTVLEQYPSVHILIVSMYADEKFKIEMKDLGAKGYLVKNAEPEEFREAIHRVFNNESYFPGIGS